MTIEDLMSQHYKCLYWQKQYQASKHANTKDES